MKRLNKKGFTLVELLAVIVILAVIMLVGANAISAVMRSSRANSFKSSLDTAVKQANLKYTMDALNASGDALTDVLTYDKSQYEVLVYQDSGYDYIITSLTAKKNGSFKSVQCDHAKLGQFKKVTTKIDRTTATTELDKIINESSGYACKAASTDGIIIYKVEKIETLDADKTASSSAS